MENKKDLPNLPIEKQGRPTEPAFAIGALQLQTPKTNDEAYSINNRADNKPVLPPVITGTREVSSSIRHGLRAEADGIRQTFLKAVAAQAIKVNHPTTVARTLVNEAAAPEAANEKKYDRMQSLINDRKTVYQTLGRPQTAAVEPAPANQLLENFTSPGVHQQETLLTENKFVPTRVLQAEHSRQFKEGFRRHFEAKRDAEERREHIQVAEGDRLRTNNLGSAFGTGAPSSINQPASADGTYAEGNLLTSPEENNRLNKPRITYQLVDSRDRNYTLYPDANTFVFSLGRRFNNVKRVKMISSEIPNTDTIIRDDPKAALYQNNRLLFECGKVLNNSNQHIYWLNDEDPANSTTYECVIYDAIITPGNYVTDACNCNTRTLAEEMEAVISGVTRFAAGNPDDAGVPHQFQVTIDSQTNIVSVLSVQSRFLASNPINTINGQNIITVNQTDAIGTYVLNDPVLGYVTITGATATGGIPASVLNNTHQILSLNTDSYTFRVTTVANQTVSGGGTNVQAGIEKPFMLLASNVDTPFSKILGFPQQDSSQQIATPIEFIQPCPPNLATGEDCTEIGSNPAWIQATNHGLSVGDTILIVDTNTIPSINGLQTVTSVVDDNNFEVNNQVIKVVNNQVTTTQFVLGCVVISLDQEITEITNMTVSQAGSICTQYPHGLSHLAGETVNNVVWLGNIINGLTESLVDINGIQTATQFISDYCFNINDGVIFGGTDNSNAFAVKTSSTKLVPITSILPANNGRICPAPAVSVLAGTSVPQYVLFHNTNTTPNLNGTVVVDQDAINSCAISGIIAKNTTEAFWQTFIPSVTSKLIDIYVRLGEGMALDTAVMHIYTGVGPVGISYNSQPAYVDSDVCTGAHFCLPDIPLIANEVYTWEIQLTTRPNQQVAVCTNTIYSGTSDLGLGIGYDFRTYMSAGLHEIDYYSQISGKFDLTTYIEDVITNPTSQNYIVSLEGNLFCIQDAVIASNGVWTFNQEHGLAAGDNFFVGRINTLSSNETTVPFVEPNVLGLLTVDSVINSVKISSSIPITLSNYIASGMALEIVKTSNTSSITIANIYPMGTGYLCLNTNTCDLARRTCYFCAGDQVVIRGTSDAPVFCEGSISNTTLTLTSGTANYGDYVIAQNIVKGDLTTTPVVTLITGTIPSLNVLDVTAAVGNIYVGTIVTLPDTSVVVVEALLAGVIGIYPNQWTITTASGTIFVPTVFNAETSMIDITSLISGSNVVLGVEVATYADQQTNITTITDYGTGTGQLGTYAVYPAPLQNYSQIVFAIGIPVLALTQITEVLTATTYQIDQTQNVAAQDLWIIPYQSNLWISVNAIHTENVYGCYTLDKVYNNTSSSCNTIFDIQLTEGSLILPDDSLIPDAFNLGEIARLDTDGGVNGYNGTFASAVVYFTAGQTCPDTSPITFNDSLFVQTQQPHNLVAGDAIYIIYPQFASNCSIVESTFGEYPQPEPNIHNTLAFVFPDATDATKFQIYGLPIVSGTSSTPASCQSALPAGVSVVNDVQFYYHKICGTTFQSINSFYPHSENGMFESVDNGLYKAETSTISWQTLPEFWYGNAVSSSSVTNINQQVRGGSYLPDNPFTPGPGPGNLTVYWPSHGRDAITQTDFAFSRMNAADNTEDNPPVLNTIGVNWIVVDPDHLIWTAYTGLGVSGAFGGSGAVATALSTSLVDPTPSMYWTLHTTTKNPNYYQTQDYAIWYQIDFLDANGSRGSQPDVPVGTTLIGPVQISAVDVASTIASKTVSAINAASPIGVNLPLTVSGPELDLISIVDSQLGTLNEHLSDSLLSPTFATIQTESTEASLYIGQAKISRIALTQGCCDSNGCHTASAINEDFFAVTDGLVVKVGNVTSPNGNAGQFVITDSAASCSGVCSTLSVANIAVANDGVIVSPNNFQSGDCVYFLEDTNLNVETSTDLRNNFFTVSDNNLSSTEFSLTSTPITDIGGIFGNTVNVCDTIVYNEPGQHCFIAVASEYDVILAGAGGGNGLDYSNGSAGTGGRGGLTVGTITVPVGTEIHIFVGGAGQNGLYSQNGIGGDNGGGNSFANDYLNGNGSGGGASDIRIGGQGLTNRIAVAGGGGGATGYLTTGAGTLIGYNGGQGGGIEGGNGDGYLLAADHGFGYGGTQIAGGAGANIGAGTLLANSGQLGEGGSDSPYLTTLIGPSSNAGTTGGGGGYYGGGSGLSGLTAGAFTGGAGGGSSYIYKLQNMIGNWDAATNTPTLSDDAPYPNDGDYYVVNVAGNTLLGGHNTWVVNDAVVFNGDTNEWNFLTSGNGSPANTNGYVILRQRNVAVFNDPGQYNFQIPTNATSLTIEVCGANGGTGGSGYVYTTVAPASNNLILPTATIVVVSTAGFPTTGTLIVGTSPSSTLVNYSGITDTAFLGCSLGSGTIFTGTSIQDSTSVEVTGINGGRGGYMIADFIVGGVSSLQPGTTLTVTVGGQGENGPDAKAAPGSIAIGGYNGGGNGPQKSGAIVLATAAAGPSPDLITITTVYQGVVGIGATFTANNGLAQGIIACQAQFIGSVTGTALTVTFVNSGTIIPPSYLFDETGFTYYGAILNQVATTALISVLSNGAVLPQPIINVVTTAGFPSSGAFVVLGDIVEYSGITATSFTGCTGGSGVLTTGDVVQISEYVLDTPGSFPLNTSFCSKTNFAIGGPGIYDYTYVGVMSVTPDILYLYPSAEVQLFGIVGVQGAGGGASSVQLPDGENLIVAGGGGGGTGGNYAAFGASSALGTFPMTNFYPGDGGGLIGGDAVGQVGSGGTQDVPGQGSLSGTLGQGGAGQLSQHEIEFQPVFGHFLVGAGGGGGYYGGGAGSPFIDANAFAGSFAGGGGSGYLTTDAQTIIQSSTVSTIGGTISTTGNGCVRIYWTVPNTAKLPMGHFIQVPCPGSCDPCGGQTNLISVIDKGTNGVFTSSEDTGFPVGNLFAGDSTCIFMTNGIYKIPNTQIVPELQDVIGNAIPFETPAPSYSTTLFETDIVVTPLILEQGGGFPLNDNKIDEVLTSDIRYPALNGLGWIYALDCLKNPIVSIQRDSNGTFAPVKNVGQPTVLQAGESIYIQSIQPTTPDLNGVHTVSYVDTGNGLNPQFFELADIQLLDIGGPIAAGNIIYFETEPLVGNAIACQSINAITSNVCPTLLTVTDHGYPINGNISLFISDSQTSPSINSVDGTTIVRNIINGVTVVDTNTLQLPVVDSVGASLCYVDVLNDTFVLTQPQGQFSKQILSTNCGMGTVQSDPMNNRTIIYTPVRKSIKPYVTYPITLSVPHPSGSSTITVSSGGSLLDIWPSATVVTISGQLLGNPYISGKYKIFNVTATSFDILTGANGFSTGGSGGFVTGPGPQTIPGHGLQSGDLIQISDPLFSAPDNNACEPESVLPIPQIFIVTVIDAEHFSLDTLVPETSATIKWCSNLVNVEIKDHGLVDGDIFFLYSAQSVGGITANYLNTVHGDKRRNIPTQQEIETRHTVRYVDANNIQFAASYGEFATARTLGGGYEICISARNHTNAEKAAGLKNYGFSAIQTNLSCLGDISQNFLNFSNQSYVLMTSERLTLDDATPVLNTGQVDNVFAKIQLSTTTDQTTAGNGYGAVAFNSYVGGERIFYEPIAHMDAIDIQFYRPDGQLFDLRGRDISFTLEIEEYQDRLRTANVSSRRGLNDPGAIGQIGLIESTISRENPSQNLGGGINPGQFLPALSANKAN